MCVEVFPVWSTDGVTVEYARIFWHELKLMTSKTSHTARLSVNSETKFYLQQTSARNERSQPQIQSKSAHPLNISMLTSFAISHEYTISIGKLNIQPRVNIAFPPQSNIVEPIRILNSTLLRYSGIPIGEQEDRKKVRGISFAGDKVMRLWSRENSGLVAFFE